MDFSANQAAALTLPAASIMGVCDWSRSAVNNLITWSQCLCIVYVHFPREQLCYARFPVFVALGDVQ